MPKIVALDFGLKRIGLAITDDLNIIEGMQDRRQSPIFNGGNFSPIMDNPTHHFNKWVAQELLSTY